MNWPWNTLVEQGEDVGLLKVRLYRPFSVSHMLGALPASTRRIAVLDRTKEPGSVGEPLYMDVVTALVQGWTKTFGVDAPLPQVVGGRYGVVEQGVHSLHGPPRCFASCRLPSPNTGSR